MQTRYVLVLSYNIKIKAIFTFVPLFRKSYNASCITYCHNTAVIGLLKQLHPEFIIPRQIVLFQNWIFFPRYTVCLLTHVLCKPTSFFQLFIAISPTLFKQGSRELKMVVINNRKKYDMSLLKHYNYGL